MCLPLMPLQKLLITIPVLESACMGIHNPPAVKGDVSHLGAFFLKVGKLLRYLGEGPAENGHLMFDLEAEFRVLVISPILSVFFIGGF